MIAKPHSIYPAQGFTLLELLVVMIIAGLMVALVPPMFSGAVSGTRVKAAARDLAVDLRQSRSRAIIQNTEQQVHLDLETPAYTASGKEPTALPQGMALDIELITGDRVGNKSEHTLYFFPDGSSSGELITLSGGKQVYRLHLDWLTGNISISTGTTG